MLRELVEQDLTVRQIAERVGRSPTTVRYWLRLHGLETTRAARRSRVVVDDGLIRVCHRHGATRHLARREGGYRCTRCTSEGVTRWRREIKRQLVAEAGGGCVACGYDRCLAALHFHHLDPSQKRFSLSLKGVARAADELRQEAQKCVVVCANCHAEIEAGVTALPPRCTGRG